MTEINKEIDQITPSLNIKGESFKYKKGEMEFVDMTLMTNELFKGSAKDFLQTKLTSKSFMNKSIKNDTQESISESLRSTWQLKKSGEESKRNLEMELLQINREEERNFLK